MSYNSISLNNILLRPAPYVSTTYEYNKSGDYIIGGFLIVTLSGSLIGEDIYSQIDTINNLQTQYGCTQITIGCSGNDDFLNGVGRIRTVTFSPSDQPFVITYTMVVAIETVFENGKYKPAVEPDDNFINDYCLNDIRDSLGYLQNYSEKLSFQGDANTISSVDKTLNVSKSFIKISGEINISFYGREVCGLPEYNSINNARLALETRAAKLISLQSCNNNILTKYNNWNKWLDTKKITINIDGSLTWTFDMFLSEGSAKPYAWIDIDTEDKKDQKTNKKGKVISGKIKGLSSANISDWLGHKVDAQERIANAEKAYDELSDLIKSGSWPETDVVLYDVFGKIQDKSKYNFCFQRLSSNIVKSVIAGEINFSAEFGDISACRPNGESTIDITIDETFSVNRYAEFTIPNSTVVVQRITPSTPARVTITARGSIQNCNTNSINQLAGNVEVQLSSAYNKIPYFRKLILMSEKKNIGKYSYTLTKEYLACDYGYLGTKQCTTDTSIINLYSEDEE